MLKKMAIASIVLFVILVIYFISSPGLDMLAKMARDNWEIATWAPGLLFKAGSIAFLTLRWEKAADFYYEFNQTCGYEHNLSGLASFRLAKCYLEMGSTLDAANELRYFIDNFPDDPNYESALAEAKRLAHIPGYQNF